MTQSSDDNNEFSPDGDDQGMGRLSEEEKSQMKAQIFQRLRLKTGTRVPRDPRRGRIIVIRTLFTLAAAAVLGVLFLPYLLKRAGLASGPVERAYVLAQRTGTGEKKRMLLSDSTTVILSANSSLEFASGFAGDGKGQPGGAREVRLEGNAYFIVRKSAAYQPFVIHSHGVSVTVLGTELDVDGRSNAPEVVLTTGKVRVAHDAAPAKALVLLPGERVRTDTGNHGFIRDHIHPGAYSAWTEGRWEFERTSLEEIAHLLHEYYGVEVVFESEASKKLRVTAVLATGPIGELLPVLSTTLHIPITLSGNRLLISRSK
jgi:ferric-dicitrate binding protein FerR (iron transport regulator)